MARALCLINAGDEALGFAAVSGVVFAEVVEERGFFNADAVEKRESGGHQDQSKAKPVAGVKTDSEEDEEQSQIAGVADDAIKTGPLHRLLIADGDVGTE